MNQYPTITSEDTKNAKALLADRTYAGRPLISLGHETRTIIASELAYWKLLQRGGFVAIVNEVETGDMTRITVKLLAAGRRFAGQQTEIGTYGISVNK